jgi:hypothetical protein
MTGTLPPGAAVTRLASLDSGSPVAWDSSGTHLAYNRNGIRIVSVATGETARIAPGNATAFAWSFDSDRLAAAFPDGPLTRVALFDRSGDVVGETRVAGNVGAIAWRRGGELLITASELRAYSFGGTLILRLYRWNGTDDPRETMLTNTTLKRSTIPLWNSTYRSGADMVLSPLQDEIAFARIIDPPMYPPYLRIVLHHLETGTERDITILPLGSAVPAFTPDGEQLLAGDGTAEGRLIDAAGDTTPPELPFTATRVTLSPGGANRLNDGHLTIPGRGITTFPADCRGSFSPNGTSLALIRNTTLYHVSGFPEDREPKLPEAVRDRLLFLRKLRSERLISSKDYLGQKERMLHP